MPRQSRIDNPGALHHIIVRGIERCKIFKDDQDRFEFVEKLGSILKETETSYIKGAGIKGAGGSITTYKSNHVAPASNDNVIEFHLSDHPHELLNIGGLKANGILQAVLK